MGSKSIWKEKCSCACACCFSFPGRTLTVVCRSCGVSSIRNFVFYSRPRGLGSGRTKNRWQKTSKRSTEGNRKVCSNTVTELGFPRQGVPAPRGGGVPTYIGGCPLRPPRSANVVNVFSLRKCNWISKLHFAVIIYFLDLHLNYFIPPKLDRIFLFFEYYIFLFLSICQLFMERDLEIRRKSVDSWQVHR